MGIKVGLCGTGAFSRNFITLFKMHPQVDDVVLCDLDAEKLKAAATRYELPKTCPSLDELCQLDLDAVAIFTQNWLHGPQAVQALRAGKHVYSAVPSAIALDEIEAIVRTTAETGLIYMVGETSYYYPCAIYCRERFRNGDFGDIVYAEGEYYHDWDHGLYDVMKWRGGDNWRWFAGAPPMHYPTHSASMLVSVTGAYATSVSCLGWADHHEDGLYLPGANKWGNVFSNECALCRMSDGSMFRVNEFRRIGHPGTVGMSLYGTQGSFEQQTGPAGAGYSAKSSIWMTKDRNDRLALDDLLSCAGVRLADVDSAMGHVTSADGTHQGASKVHDLARLPREYVGLPNGHAGSHQFLIDDFVRGCVDNVQPPNNAWMAARYLVPGLIAHESAQRNGEQLPVPDFGDPPA